jgi:hypothetical protein
MAAWTDSLLPSLVASARSRREAAEAAAAEKLAARALERGELRDQAMAVLRRQLRHVIFTEPEVPRAGEKVTVYYSPASTNLAGRQQLFITAGFNRWGHLRKLGPAAMMAPAIGSHHRVGAGCGRGACLVGWRGWSGNGRLCVAARTHASNALSLTAIDHARTHPPPPGHLYGAA